MANNSTYIQIKNIVENSDRGTLFFPDSFSEYGSSDAVRSALVRLCETGILLRVAQGIYCYPRIDTKWGSGTIPPSIEEIAEGIASRDRVRIAPSGAYALYQLGLTTQIPGNVVFITDGSPRRVTIGKGRGILFKHTSEMRTFAYNSKLMALIVTAMREIGEGNISQEQIKQIKSHLSEVPEEDFKHDVSLAPIWVRKALSERQGNIFSLCRKDYINLHSMVSSSVHTMLPKIQAVLAQQPVVKAWLFGSYSRGEETPQSDVDILVQYDENARITLLTISRIMTRLSDAVGKKVDLVEDGCLLPFAQQSAERDKILIYERAS